MHKPTPQTIQFLDYIQCQDYINEKYKVDLRNYANKTFMPDDTAPYQDFWHHLIDQNPEIQNGSFFTMWPLDMDYVEPWQQEIYRLFWDEFSEYADENHMLQFKVDW